LTSCGGFATDESDITEEIEVTAEAGVVVDVVLSLPTEESLLRQLHTEVERVLVELEQAPSVRCERGAAMSQVRFEAGAILCAQSSKFFCRASESRSSCDVHGMRVPVASTDCARNSRVKYSKECLKAGGPAPGCNQSWFRVMSPSAAARVVSGFSRPCQGSRTSNCKRQDCSKSSCCDSGFGCRRSCRFGT